MKIILFDTPAARSSLFPFTSVRSIADIRNGICTIKERWEKLLQTNCFILTEDYLQHYFEEFTDEALYINTSALPSHHLVQVIHDLKLNEGLFQEETLLAFKTTVQLNYGFSKQDCSDVNWKAYEGAIHFLRSPFHINQQAHIMLEMDFALVTKGRTSAPISSTNAIISGQHIFIEEGAVVEHCTINAADAFVYIGKHALIMEGTMIRGSFAALEKTVVKMGAKIYGTTIAGKQCTIGGEIKNTVFFDYSNKAHDGYLGDAVIGSWCNLGAGTSASNVKNTAGEIKIWNPLLHQWVAAGTKCGVMLGDYSRTGINTSLNTGTVAGVCCNIVSDAIPPKYIPHFTWNTATGERFVFDKAIASISNWAKMKQQQMSETETQILQYIYNSI